MQVCGGLREKLEFGHRERREQRNCPDVVNRQHGSVSFALLYLTSRNAGKYLVTPAPAHPLNELSLPLPVSPGVANFLELRTGEVRRIPFPHTSVNKGKRKGRSRCASALSLFVN